MIQSTHIRVSSAIQDALRKKSAEKSEEKNRRVTISEIIELALAALEADERNA